MKKLIKYTKAYSSGAFKLIEGDIFKTEIPIARENIGEDSFDERVKERVNLLENEKIIMEYIRDNSKSNQKDIAMNTQIPYITVRRIMDYLKEKGYIKREGSDKAGYWKLLK